MPDLFTIAQILTATVTLWQSPTTLTHLDTKATHYAPGLMAQVASNRNMDLTRYHSGVALNHAGDLGRVVWLEWKGHKPTNTTPRPVITGPHHVTGPHLVVDCAQGGGHFVAREEHNLGVEVDAELAEELDFYALGPVPVTVHFENPTPSRPARLKPR